MIQEIKRIIKESEIMKYVSNQLGFLKQNKTKQERLESFFWWSRPDKLIPVQGRRLEVAPEEQGRTPGVRGPPRK